MLGHAVSDLLEVLGVGLAGTRSGEGFPVELILAAMDARLQNVREPLRLVPERPPIRGNRQATMGVPGEGAQVPVSVVMQNPWDVGPILKPAVVPPRAGEPDGLSPQHFEDDGAAPDPCRSPPARHLSLGRSLCCRGGDTRRQLDEHGIQRGVAECVALQLDQRVIVNLGELPGVLLQGCAGQVSRHGHVQSAVERPAVPGAAQGMLRRGLHVDVQQDRTRRVPSSSEAGVTA